MNKQLLPWAISVGVVLAAVVAVWPVGIEWQKLMTGKLVSPAVSQISQVTTFSTPMPTPWPVLTKEEILAWSREQLPSQVVNLPQNEITQIILVGDMMLGRTVNYNMHRKRDFAWPVAQVADRLKQADITIANLESPILANCPLTGEGTQLCASQPVLYTLYFAGIDIVQVANNHILDYGEAGARETQAWVNYQSIADTGLGKAAVKEVRGRKFGFLAYNQIWPTKEPVNTATVASLQQDIKELSTEADVVLVGWHWGEEYRAQPNAAQVSLARAAIDAGADVVWGHHPHWVQGIEVYRGKPIFYSLGNFVFDQMETRETREGLVVELSFWKNQLVEARLLPIFMNDFARPEWQPVGIGNVTLGRVEKLSQGM